MKHKGNVEAQERVVAALWQFARDNTYERAHMARNVDSDAEVNIRAVDKALTEIMTAFGFDVTEIQ